MSAHSLKIMLSSIKNGKSINLLRFKKLVDSLNLGVRFELSDIKATKSSGNNYRVIGLPTELDQVLKHYVNQIGDDRISSARQNLSHNHKVMGSYLLLIHDAHLSGLLQSSNISHPMVITIDAQGMPSYPPSFLEEQPLDMQASAEVERRKVKDAVIIENRQLFLNWTQTKAFLQTRCQFSSSNYDVIFGAGNDISNSLHRKFLSDYQKLYVCGDIDLGGMTIASNLIKLLPDSLIELVIPDDLEQRLNQVASFTKPKTVSDIRHICSHHVELYAVSDVITKTHKTLEQESYLYD
ncbi:Wadjet anti-phage system protein JetD domain-containing protein [Psychrobacter sp. ANT_H3]|uniref:Wadjet anti-phage system protein JetD domain-containing protein n=1 Tax=Psychrobacter sp. ANT_H3 TaxID=3019444 RepID=UPI0022F166FA|nr:Wadjet anti-phage system protein JetD domain-containing protein [Psychrobacter sp. ANT_H3]MDA5133621.1 DUF2220 family protein [Psychrobacter sp. ANT_H3]